MSKSAGLNLTALSKYIKQIISEYNYEYIFTQVEKEFKNILNEYYIETYTEIIKNAIEKMKEDKRKILSEIDFVKSEIEIPEPEIEKLSKEEWNKLKKEGTHKITLVDNEKFILNPNRVKNFIKNIENVKISSGFIEKYMENVAIFIKYYVLKSLKIALENNKKKITSEMLKEAFGKE